MHETEEQAIQATGTPPEPGIPAPEQLRCFPPAPSRALPCAHPAPQHHHTPSRARHAPHRAPGETGQRSEQPDQRRTAVLTCPHVACTSNVAHPHRDQGRAPTAPLCTRSRSTQDQSCRSSQPSQLSLSFQTLPFPFKSDIATHMILTSGSATDVTCTLAHHVSAGHRHDPANSDIRDQCSDLHFQHSVVLVPSERKAPDPALISY